jgi:hypothetical protein
MTRTHARARTRAHTHSHARMHAHKHIPMRSHARMHAYMHTHARASTHAHVRMHTHAQMLKGHPTKPGHSWVGHPALTPALMARGTYEAQQQQTPPRKVGVAQVPLVMTELQSGRRGMAPGLMGALFPALKRLFLSVLEFL